MSFKVYRCAGKAILPIVTVAALSGSIPFEHSIKVPYLTKEILYFPPHEHTELRQYNLPKTNNTISGTTNISSTSTTSTTA